LKEKTKSKSKSKSKTLDKQSKEKYFFVKVTTSKSKRKNAEEDLGFLSKKVSPRKSKDHPFLKEIVGSDLVHKQGRKSVLNHKLPSTKKMIFDHKSPKRRSNVYGLQY
jgi:hypothetical protein